MWELVPMLVAGVIALAACAMLWRILDTDGRDAVVPRAPHVRRSTDWRDDDEYGREEWRATVDADAWHRPNWRDDPEWADVATLWWFGETPEAKSVLDDSEWWKNGYRWDFDCCIAEDCKEE